MTSLRSSVAAKSKRALPMPSMRPASSSKSCVLMVSSLPAVDELQLCHSQTAFPQGKTSVCLTGLAASARRAFQ